MGRKLLRSNWLKRAAGTLTFLAIALPAHAQSQSARRLGALEDPRIDVGGENPVFPKRKIFLSYDWQDLQRGGKLNRVRLRMLHPFGPDARYSWQIELPYEHLREADGDIVRGLSDIGTRLSWTFFQTQQLRQNLGLNVQWQTANDSRLSDNATVLQPQYAFSYAHSETFVVSGQLTYAGSVDRAHDAPIVNRLAFEPSATVLLPDRWSSTVATRLSWNFERKKLAATVRGTLGFILGQRKEWELDAYIEHALTDLARQAQFENRVGIDLVRYF
jgi:Putative MetA-pathway of phenol degradation